MIKWSCCLIVFLSLRAFASVEIAKAEFNQYKIQARGNTLLSKKCDNYHSGLFKLKMISSFSNQPPQVIDNHYEIFYSNFFGKNRQISLFEEPSLPSSPEMNFQISKGIFKGLRLQIVTKEAGLGCKAIYELSWLGKEERYGPMILQVTLENILDRVARLLKQN